MDAGPLEEEGGAAVQRMEVVVVEEVVYGDWLFGVLVAGDVEVGQELQLALPRGGELLLERLMVLGEGGLELSLDLLRTVLLDLDLVVYLLVLVLQEGDALIEGGFLGLGGLLLLLEGGLAVSYTHLTLPTTPYV